MQPHDIDETRASARLPHLDIEIVHRRPREGGAELLTLALRGTPSFAAFEQFLEAANPFSYWMRAAEMMWLPWRLAARQLTRDLADEAPALAATPRLPPPRRSKT